MPDNPYPTIPPQTAPMISIIIPTYNSCTTIVEALDSVLAQTLWGNSVASGAPRVESSDESQSSSVLGTPCSALHAYYEVIIVDDCSSDDTVAVVEKWISDKTSGAIKESDASRLTLLTLSINAGPAGARNAGIAVAKGEWIAFLDADDLWPEDKLALQVAAAARNPEVGLWCGLTVTFETGQREQALAAIRQNASARVDVPPIRLLDLEEFAFHNPVATSTVLVRSDLIRACQGFDEQFRGPEDYDLWMRILERSPGTLVETAFAWYEQRQGSLSMDDRTFLPQVLRVLEKAFAPGGVFSGRRMLQRRALANQYWNASWMAFQRGSRQGALMYLARAVVLHPGVGGRRQFPLWWRYVLGSRGRA